MKKRLEQRMYGLVPYNISPIQQGIQFGHAVVEYGLEYGQGHADDPYLQWARNDKTFIILNGGTTNKNEDRYGTLNIAQSELYAMGVQLSTFNEPDLGDQLTAVVFLVDERVWDREKYPEYDELIHEPVDEPNYYFNLFGDDTDKILGMRKFLSRFKLA
jgi:hypothetical protein